MFIIKPKKHIFLNALNCLANTNFDFANSNYLKLNALFIYNATFIYKIYLILVFQILVKYETNNY